MKTNVCKIALMFLIGTALSLLFNSCSKDPVIPENETDNKLHEDPSKMTIRLVECHLHADWNEIQKVGGPHQNPESPAKHMKRIQEITYELKAGKGWRLAEGSQSKFYVQKNGDYYTYGKYTLADLLLEYKQEHPNVNFNVISDQSNILFRKMLEDSIDVGFIRGDYEGPVNRTLIGQNEACLVTKEPVDFEDLPKMQQIGYKTNDRTKELLDGWWKDRFGTDTPANMMVGYIDVAWQLIHKGLGYTICFLPDNFVNEYDLCLTPLVKKDGTPVLRNTWFIYSKNKRISKVLEEFIYYIESEFKI